MKCIKCASKKIKFDFIGGKIFCKACGYHVEENISNPDILFSNDKNKQKKITGYIHSLGSKQTQNSLSKTSKMTNVQRKLNQLAMALKLTKKITNEAFEIFKRTQSNTEIKMRRTDLASVSCLYFTCRKNMTPHLMVDFSDFSQISINKIGSEFLKYSKILKLVLPIVDPSLFIYRFVSKLNFGTKSNMVSTTALRLIARMKRDWLVSGRRPSGLCGAAILLSSRMHGVNIDTTDISKIVRIGSCALKARLREMNLTSIGSLTKFDINSGGGDDGKKESLFGSNNDFKFLPPSKISKKSNEDSIKKKKNAEKKYTNTFWSGWCV
mmetsp:Transcript_23880/g.37362  ORF Transcript_23880/g.37362 Transcript_23880/m.37362 type:complete len:324 (+) Transcript_23880:68-1039(+)